MDIHDYLEKLKESLFQTSNWQKVIMSREWTATIPSVPGVYALKENQEIVYVGETGNLRGRMIDLLDSRQHTVRRTIGEKLYASIEGFEKATSSKKFPSHIEKLVNDHICTKLEFAFIEVKLGRKELEEYVERSIKIEFRLNKRGKRKSAF